MLLTLIPFHILGVVAALRMIPAVRALKGDSSCGQFLCVNATLEDNMVTYEMTTLMEPFGWVALGFGRKMNNTHMIIMWKNEDGSTTLSHRKGWGHFEPLPVEYPPRHARIVDSKITSWHPVNSTTLSFQIPANRSLLASSDSAERLIWAYSKVRPDKYPSSLLTQHFTAGFLRLDLNKDLSVHDHGDSPPRPSIDHTDTEATTVESYPHEGHHMLIVAHGVIASFGFLVLLPAGALVARWARALTPKWFKTHQALMLISVPIITIGWVLGPIAVMQHEAAHLFDAHQITGAILVILYYIQISLGRYIHGRRSTTLSPILTIASIHPASNILHIALGIMTITVAFIQVRSGMEEWRLVTGGADVPHWCHDLWNAWVVIVPVAYFSGTVLLPRQLHQERTGVGTENYVSLTVTPPGSHTVFEVSDEEFGKGRHSAESVELTREIRELESSVPLLNSHRK